MDCKECYNRDLCDFWQTLSDITKVFVKDAECGYFKDKSKIIKLPCKVGDKVYKIHHFNIGNVDEVIEGDILSIYIEKDIRIKCFWEMAYYRSFKIDDIGKTVFLTREDAEKALKSMNYEK